ncbi:hypothetical protein [Paraburkholderia phenazinium]|uniref:Dolichyl-phosphate-mannose-protein mannosyltransferase n=1 Tax=Paraburkholderia phenazinium TaxID=60549 RepID=A0A1G8EN64_9BURK|nr:hypothetical protein [Paraburkholderia phenazinium]SDH71347.1 hypothetical protein SAMN05216466_112158 [Paraburkholderia phenazinium]
MKPKHYSYALLFLALMSYLWMTCSFMPFPADFEDSYIMHRYAQNGVDGFMFEWNPHSAPVQGTTGIAWVTLVTMLARLTKFNVISVNSYAGLIFAILTLLAVYAATLRNFNPNRWVAICALIPIISSPFFTRSSANGLETSITLFFVALSIYLLRFCRNSFKDALWLGVFSGFTLLIRPDLPLFPVSLFVIGLALNAGNPVQRIRNCLALLLAAFACALVSLLLAKFATGTALPLSASLKFALSDLVLGRLPKSQYNYILGPQLSFLSYVLPLVLLALVPLIALDLKESKKYIPIYGACGVYFAYLFSVLPIMDVAYRFQLPLLIGLSFSLVHFFELMVKSGVSGKRACVLIFSIGLLLAVGNTALLFSGKKEAQMLRADHNDFADIGRQLGTIPGISIASPEAGKLAAYSGQKFFDTVGLNNLFVANNRNKPNYPVLLEHYLQTDFGMPDVYIRKPDTADAAYTFLEILPDFKQVYLCNSASNAERIGKVVCVNRSGSEVKSIVANLASSGVEIALP